MNTCRALLGAALLAIGVLAHAASDLMSAARVHPPYHGLVPAHSDVIFSSRFTRPEAIPVIRAYGANRVEWVYTKDAAFAAQLKAVAPWFGGTLNANGPLPSDAGYARDFDGKVLFAPWMQGWGSFWVTTTHPDTQRVIQEQLRGYLALGADSLQYDDPQLQVFAALYQAGDFNESTQRGFPAWLAKSADPARVRAAGLAGFEGSYRDWLVRTQQVRDADDYRKRFRQFASTALWLDYTRSTVLDHHRRLREAARAIKGRPLPVSMNFSVLYEPLQSNPQFFLAPLADYSMSETQTLDASLMAGQAATARALGLGLAPSIRPRGRADNRVAIAHLHALGGQAVVPWDVYDGNDDQGKAKRFFGAAADYADLYAFVRSRPKLFDGLETTPVVGVVVPVERGDANVIRPLIRRLVERQIPFAFVPVGHPSGGEVYRAVADRLRHLRLLVTTNPDADYGVEDLAALAASGVARTGRTELRDEQLGALQWTQAAPSNQNLRIVPRARPDDPDRLVLHVVDDSRGEPGAADPQCRRRLGISRSGLGPGEIAAVSVSSLGAGADVRIEPRTEAGYVYVTIEGCALWSIVELRMRR